MPDENGAVPQEEKTHKVEYIKAYRYRDLNKQWHSCKVGDKVDLPNVFYANFKKLGIIKDAK